MFPPTFASPTRNFLLVSTVRNTPRTTITFKTSFCFQSSRITLSPLHWQRFANGWPQLKSNNAHRADGPNEANGHRSAEAVGRNEMRNLLIKAAIRTLFTFTSRDKALGKSKHYLRQYSELARRTSKEAGQLCVEVPPMRGVDEDMRKWSFFMILEHNAIVNRSITTTVVQLARGEALSGPATINPKKDVMPSSAADESQVEVFSDSVSRHIEAVKNLKHLRGTRTSPHPIFGEFDAHKWNCMFAFHLSLHLRQAEHVVSKAKAEQAGRGNALPRAPHS